MIRYVENERPSSKKLAALRHSVGWNGMEECYKNFLMTPYWNIACYDDDKLIGFVDSVSNAVTDAYIQDLIVAPTYQGQGIGTELMNKIINKLKESKIYMISVIYEEKLLPFYKQFGFYPMIGGQMQTFEME